MAIKDVLREELERSLQMQKDYDRELAKLPRGSLVRRLIKGHVYFYLVYREDGKVRTEYRGQASKEEIEKYRHAKERRAIYRGSIAKLKKQIRFLKGTLRGKEPI